MSSRCRPTLREGSHGSWSSMRAPPRRTPTDYGHRLGRINQYTALRSREAPASSQSVEAEKCRHKVYRRPSEVCSRPGRRSLWWPSRQPASRWRIESKLNQDVEPGLSSAAWAAGRCADKTQGRTGRKHRVELRTLAKSHANSGLLGPGGFNDHALLPAELHTRGAVCRV